MDEQHKELIQGLVKDVKDAEKEVNKLIEECWTIFYRTIGVIIAILLLYFTKMK